jgi:hypothetical protein
MHTQLHVSHPLGGWCSPGAAQRSTSVRHLLRKPYLRFSWMSLNAARERYLHESKVNGHADLCIESTGSSTVSKGC